jgi:hypothetical protein
MRPYYDVIKGSRNLAPVDPGEMMKLPLISASVVIYALLATAWICNAGLLALF